MYNVHCNFIQKISFSIFIICLIFRLEQLDKTNERLDGVNKLSAKRYLDASRDFSCHAHLLTTMKNDLDLIFKKIK